VLYYVKYDAYYLLSSVSETPYEKFGNVKMPRWYRTTAWALRAVGLLTLTGFAWHMTHQDSSGASWPIAGVIVGIFLLVLPSLPKAYIEQRNRTRGLRDGSFKEFLENEKQKDR
jgi:hypothetical protein